METDHLVDACLAPFKMLTGLTFECEAIIQQYNTIPIWRKNISQFICNNGKSIIGNTIYEFEKEYDIQLRLLYEKFNVEIGQFYKLPEKEREHIRRIYHYVPILKMNKEFIDLAYPFQKATNCDPQDNPFIKIVAGYQRLYGDSYKWWIKELKENGVVLDFFN